MSDISRLEYLELLEQLRTLRRGLAAVVERLEALEEKHGFVA